MPDKLPKSPSDTRVRVLRVLHPEDPTEIVQLELVDTGNVTSDGIKIFTLVVGSGGGPVPAVPGTTIHGGYQLPDGAVHQLPAVALVSGVTLVTPSGLTGNAGAIWTGGDNTVAVNNGAPIEPGESLPIDALNLDQLWVIGTANDWIFWIGG